MFLSRLGFPPAPFHSPDDSGGGGGEVDGGSAVIPSTGDGASAATPEAIELDDEKLIRVKGQDKPVKFGDHVRGFQSQFTKASQRAARLEQELKAARERIAAVDRERQAAEVRRQFGQTQQAEVDPFGAIEALPYLSGKDAAQVLRQLTGQLGQGTQEQRMVMAAMLKKLVDLEERHQVLMSNHTQQSFEGKISRWLEAGGFAKEWADTAKKLYLAYEPSQELDDEFPQLLKDHIEGIQRVIEAQRTQKLSQARRQPFVPGRGSNVGPSKALEIDPAASPREAADLLWNSIRDADKA